MNDKNNIKSENEFVEKHTNKDNSKEEKKEIINLQKHIHSLKKEVNDLKSELENKVKSINQLNSKINEFNSNYKNDITKKAQEAQSTLDLKIKEYQAKYENELKEIKKYGLKDKFPSLINIISNFEMALSSNPSDPVIINYLKGFEMFLSMFKNFLLENGVTEIQIKIGDPFDEKIMEAIDLEENNEFKSNHVIKILKKGYKLHDLVLVHATVILSK